MEIIRKEENGVEFYTVELTGQSGMSQSGLAALAGVSRQSLIQLEETLVSKAPSKPLEPFLGKALTLVISDSTIQGRSVGNLKIYKASYCAAVLKHYADPEKELRIEDSQRATATYSLLKFAERGINDWIQEITGWKERVQSLQPHTGVYIKRLENIRDHEVPDHLWTVFRESAELLLLIEKDWRVPINDYDILDGSIGRRWSDYREAKPWIGLREVYTHQYRDKRGPVNNCAAYQLNELPYFRRWLRECYISTHLPRYLVEKYGKQAVRQIYTEIGQLTDLILEITEVKRLTPQEAEKYQIFLLSRQKLLGGFDPI